MSVYPSAVLLAVIYGMITDGDLYLALFTGNPTPLGNGPEVTGGSYERQVIEFGSIVNNKISNNALIAFGGLPAGTVTHWGIFDAETNGNLKVYGALDYSVVAQAGDEINFPVGNLSISISGS